MSSAANKKLIQKIFAAAGNPDPAMRDRALFVASLADDAKWVVTGQYSWSQTFTGKQAILHDLHGHVRDLLAERTRTVAHRFIADGDYVVVEAKGDNVTKTGERYDNDYCLVFQLKDGQIKEIREYCELGADRKSARAVSRGEKAGRLRIYGGAAIRRDKRELRCARAHRRLMR